MRRANIAQESRPRRRLGTTLRAARTVYDALSTARIIGTDNPVTRPIPASSLPARCAARIALWKATLAST
jgi:hypothetical protein